MQVNVKVVSQPHFQWNIHKYPEISKTSELFLLFGQGSLDAQLVGYNFLGILKDYFGNIS